MAGAISDYMVREQLSWKGAVELAIKELSTGHLHEGEPTFLDAAPSEARHASFSSEGMNESRLRREIIVLEITQ